MRRWPVSAEDLFFNPRHLGPTLSVSLHQCCIILVIYTLLVAEGQRSELWEHSKHDAVSEMRGHRI